MNARYGGDHEAIRRASLPYAYSTPCTRCGRPMLPGQELDLDHTDDRAGYRGFSHARCNRQAGGRLGRARQLAQRREIRIMLTECTLGVEIAEDRAHTSIVAAGYVGDEPDQFILVDLVAYLAGTNAVPELVRLRQERTVRVVIDPHSPAATLIKPLKDEGFYDLLEPSTSDVVVAHGLFLDTLAAGRLRHAGQAELDAAVRHGTQRPLGGANTWTRRGTTVDVAPLTAATLAVWALTAKTPFNPGVWVEWR